MAKGSVVVPAQVEEGAGSPSRQRSQPSPGHLVPGGWIPISRARVSPHRDRQMVSTLGSCLPVCSAVS